MEESINYWYKRIWETRGARFNAFRRNKFHKKASTWTMAILSIYVIAVNVYALGYPNQVDITILKICNITLSIFILATNLILSGIDYGNKAAIFHTCGKELSSVYSSIISIKTSPKEYSLNDIESIIDTYQKIINNYKENHTPIDYEIFMLDNYSEYKKDSDGRHKYFIFLIKIYIKKFLYNYLFYLLLVLCPTLITLFFLISKKQNIYFLFSQIF